MDPLSNRSRKNILSLNSERMASVTGMATQLHPLRQHQPQQQQQQNHHHHHHQHLQHQHRLSVGTQQHLLAEQVTAQPQHRPASPPPVTISHHHQQDGNHHLQHHHHHLHLHHQQQQQQQQQHVDGLPQAFVAAMRTLFDIMDDRKTGFVRLADIEERWQDDGSKGLPSGVIDSLRKVTPPNGLLSFERFCGGLKICLLRNQTTVGHGGSSSLSLSSPPSSPAGRADILARDAASERELKGSMGKLSLSRPPSAPLLDLETGSSEGSAGSLGNKLPLLGASTWANAGPLNTATVRPNNAMPAQKTLSMPQLLGPDPDLDLEPPPIILPGAYGPPKPPRVSLNLGDRGQHQQQQQQQHHHHHGLLHHHLPPSTGASSSIDKAEIRNALQNWQMSLLMGEAGGDKSGGDKGGMRAPLARGSADGQTDLSTSSPSLQSIHQLDGGRFAGSGLYQKKPSGSAGRRREPRRHTLQNGVDYNMLKRLKQIEQEKDILLQGLSAVEKTRDWYLKQLAAVQEKIRYLGRPGSHMEQWTETQQERLDLQRARVLEVNRHLMMLAESWERGGFPMHMNLALRPLPGTTGVGSPYALHPLQRPQSQSTQNMPPAIPPPPPSGSYQPSPPTQPTHHHHQPQPQQQQQPEMVNHLKQQNHQLAEEINQKNEKLTLLEREKAALIRELMQVQRANRASSMISNTEEMVF
uniref:Suppressor APC domain-containing protein n=1 Tax=Anopheles atroparvus TaxID=41427 RepID=A0AAG5DUD4_ANOAO